MTGAGGSIGSEFSRQILAEHPAMLLLVEHNEFGLYEIHRELEAQLAEISVDVTTAPRPDTVVPLARQRA